MNLKPLDLKLLGIRFQTQPSYNRWIHVITVGQREQFYKDHEKMCRVSVYMVQSERFSMFCQHVKSVAVKKRRQK